MRRQDCEMSEPEELEGVLARAEWGTLGLVSAQGTPVLVPLNFVFHQDQIFFHGAKAGEKFGLIQAAPQASFLVVEAYAQIPSYAFDPANACPATQFFRSVLVKGRVEEVRDPVRKAEVLDAIMRKLQPEGGYEPIRAEHPIYQASVRGVAVFAMTCVEMTGKIKLGQKLGAEARTRVGAVLEARGGPMDAHTLGLMRSHAGGEGGAR
jgi:hypothetical protein